MRVARFTVSSVSAISRHGAISASASSPMVWPVEGTMRRTRSISSPKNSIRTGADACAGKMSTVSPWMWKLPGASTAPASV